MLTRDLNYETYKLAASERPSTLYRYYVSGTGLFPTDMLRYDCCWPADGEAAAMMDPRADIRRRSVLIHSYKEPTLARWSSFGWIVSAGKL